MYLYEIEAAKRQKSFSRKEKIDGVQENEYKEIEDQGKKKNHKSYEEIRSYKKVLVFSLCMADSSFNFQQWEYTQFAFIHKE